MNTYVMENTKLKTATENDFNKSFFKVMSNSVFGTTMENIRNHWDIKLVTNQDTYIKYVQNSFSKELFAVEMGKTETRMKKLVHWAVHLGQVILNLRKWLTCEHYYNYMHPKWGNGMLYGHRQFCCVWKRGKEIFTHRN